MAVELGVGYISLVPETGKFEAGVKKALQDVGKHADKAGADIG